MSLKPIWEEARQAIGNEEFDRVVELIKLHPGIERVTGPEGQTLLHEVSSSLRAYEPIQPIIRTLVSAGADIEARDDEGWTPLHKAAVPPLANLEALETLIELGADVNAAIKDRTPLHLAVNDRSRIGAVAILLAHGVDVHARDSEGTTALHITAANGLHEDVKVLIEHGAKLNDVTDEGMTPLGYATAFAWPEVMTFLRERTTEELLPAWKLAEIGFIHQQVERGDVATVASMLKYKPELIKAEYPLGRWTPMAVAAREGRIDLLEVLVAHGGDVNELNDLGFNLVYIAQSWGRNNVARQWLIDHGATPAHKGRKPKAARSSFSWGKIKVEGDRLFLAGDDELARLRDFLGSDLPSDYAQFMRRFGSGNLSGGMYVFMPDRIIADHPSNREIIESRFPPAEFPYENVAELFTPEQVIRIVITAVVNDVDYFGFVCGKSGWYLFPRDGLIENMGEDLGEVMLWLIGNGTFGKKPKLVFRPIAPK